jgi:antirestriction protein ArdC
MSTTDTNRQDLYARVTARIVADLERGTRPWVKPWTAPAGERLGLLPLRANGTPYRGINLLLLWGAAQDAGYRRIVWMTYKQAAERGGHVRHGEHGSMVVFANRFTRTEANEAGEEVEREIPFLKAYTVFNAEQIDGLPAELVGPLPLATTAARSNWSPRRKAFSPTPVRAFNMAAAGPSTRRRAMSSSCRRSPRSQTQRATPRPRPMN